MFHKASKHRSSKKLLTSMIGIMQSSMSGVAHYKAAVSSLPAPSFFDAMVLPSRLQQACSAAGAAALLLHPALLLAGSTSRSLARSLLCWPPAGKVAAARPACKLQEPSALPLLLLWWLACQWGAALAVAKKPALSQPAAC